MALWRQGRKTKESLQLRLWNLNFTSNSPVPPRRLKRTQYCWMLHVASVCTPSVHRCCCVLLGVVAQSLKPVKLVAPCQQAQHCWMPHVASIFTPCSMLLRVVGSCCTNFETDQIFSYVQTDAKIPNKLGQQCWELLRLFARIA